MGAEFFQFNPRSGVAAVFGGGIARHSGRSLVGVRPTFGAFQRDDNSNVLTLSHNLTRSIYRTKLDTIVYYFTRPAFFQSSVLLNLLGRARNLLSLSKILSHPGLRDDKLAGAIWHSPLKQGLHQPSKLGKKPV
jgi:hypothetical protein